MSSVIINTMTEEERIRQMYLQFEKWATDRVSQEAYMKEQIQKIAEEWEKAATEWGKIANAWEKIAQKLEEKLKASATKFLQLGLPVEEVSDITGLPVEEIKELQG